MSRIEVRAAVGDADLERFVALRNAIVPDDSRALEEERGWLAFHGGRRALFLATLDGSLVGVAVGSPPRYGAAGGRDGFVNAWVLPDARRRGVGGALMGAACDHLRALGFAIATTWASELHPDGIAFLHAGGWREVSRERRLARDLTLPLPALEIPDPFTIAPLAIDAPDVALLYELDREATADIPGPPIDLGSYEDWRASEIDRPARRPPLLLVAREVGSIVGFANVHFPLLPVDEAWHAMTGVLRSHRGRGIAGALKLAALHALRDRGIARARTSNEERNLPMRRVNERLGFQPMPDEFLFERAL